MHSLAEATWGMPPDSFSQRRDEAPEQPLCLLQCCRSAARAAFSTGVRPALPGHSQCLLPLADAWGGKASLAWALLGAGDTLHGPSLSLSWLVAHGHLQISWAWHTLSPNKQCRERRVPACQRPSSPVPALGTPWPSLLLPEALLLPQVALQPVPKALLQPFSFASGLCIHLAAT